MCKRKRLFEFLEILNEIYNINIVNTFIHLLIIKIFNKQNNLPMAPLIKLIKIIILKNLMKSGPPSNIYKAAGSL